MGNEAGFEGVKTFLKVLLILAAVVIAIKLLPFTLVLGCGVVAAAGIALLLGVSAIAVLIGLAIVFAVLLSPIWIPVLALVGVIALFKRLNRAKA